MGPYRQDVSDAKVQVQMDDAGIVLGSLMIKSLYKGIFSLALIAAGMASQPASLRAQESSSSLALTSNTVEVASLALPSAPEVSTSMTPGRPPAAAFAPLPIVAVTPSQDGGHPHKFWDRENRILFAATGGLATADFFVTRSNLARGGRELNPLTRPFTRNTPALAANFAIETGSVMGVSYFFHKTGHHKLERLTSVVDIGGSAFAVGYGLTHR